MINEYRTEDININVGVGKSDGVLPFYMIDEYSGRNTFSKEAAEAFVKKSPEFKIREVKNIKIMTIDEIIQKYCNGCFPDFLSIDVEGVDYDLLSGINFSVSGPKVIDVEVVSSVGDIGDKIKNLLEKNGYFAYFRASENVIFIKEEYKKI